jgi:hypothetical protein
MQAWSLSAAHGTIHIIGIVVSILVLWLMPTSPLNERANDSWEFEHAAGTQRLC